MKTAYYVGSYETALATAVEDGYIEVTCPHCGEVVRVEPDAHYTDRCDTCDKQYEIIGVV